MSSSVVCPSPSTGNGRLVKLAGMDLWIMACIDNVFVYPSDLNIDRFHDALSRALSLWPIVAGRLCLLGDKQYAIEMSDDGVSLTLTNDNTMMRWPLNSNVLVDIGCNSLKPFLDEVKCENLSHGSQTEPLFRLKLTRIVKSGEWVMGSSWSHVLGDADACFTFLKALSRLYQQTGILQPLPILERRLWCEDQADLSLLPLMKHLRDARFTEETLKHFTADQATHKQVNMCFSGKQLTKLRTLVGGTQVTVQDALTAYIIVTLNTHCFLSDKERIVRANTVVNYRGVSDSIAAPGVVANCTFTMVSDDFDDLHSLSSIAKTIRRSIILARDQHFLEPCLATADMMMTRMAHENRLADMRSLPNEAIVNSNLRYDWGGLIDFGYTNKCRFYTAWAGALYFRVFRLNPVYTGNEWMARDVDGAEVAFRIENTLKDKFIDAWQNDIKEDFGNVKG